MEQTIYESVFVTRGEFDKFRKMMMEKFSGKEEKIESLTEITISGFERLDTKFITIDEKIENLTETMIDGFDMAYDRLEA